MKNILTSLLFIFSPLLFSQNLQLEFFNEYSYSPYPCFQNIIQGADGNWRFKGLEDKIPMVFSLKASKV